MADEQVQDPDEGDRGRVRAGDPTLEVAELRIRQARRAGDLDVEPGRPLHLSDDPDWWVRQLIEREQLDMTAAMPPAVALRKEADAFPGSLVRLQDEDAVRAHLEDFNVRVDRDWRRPAVGPSPTVIARQVDVERVLGQWRALRAAVVPPPPPPGRSVTDELPRRQWWRRRPRTHGDPPR